MAYREPAPKNDLIEDAEKWKEREEEALRVKKENRFKMIKRIYYSPVIFAVIFLLGLSIIGIMIYQSLPEKRKLPEEVKDVRCKDESAAIGGWAYSSYICTYPDARGRLEGNNFICTCIREGGTE